MLRAAASLRLIARVLGLALLGMLVATCGGLPAGAAGGAPRGTARGYAVIYARERYIAKTNADAIDVYWQRLPSGTPRVLYSIPPRYDVLQSAGYLPSPDGRWLYVWYALRDDRTGWPSATRFLLVSVPDGRVVPIAEVKLYRRGGDRFMLALAPVWLDSRRLLLEASFGSAIFDLRTRTFTKPLPAWPPKTLPESSWGYTSMPTPEVFLREHYAGDLQCAKGALVKLGDGLGLKDSLTDGFEPETLASMLARSVGLARPDPPPGAGGAVLMHPELACSPNHRYLARAAVLPTDTEIQYKDLKGQWQKGREVAVRLDFFDLTKGEAIGTGAEDVLAGVFAREGRPFRAYNLPRLGDLRFSPDGRFFSYTAYDILPPHGHPSMRFGTAKVQGRHGFLTTGVYIRDSWWATADPEKTDREPHRYEWLYFIPDALNAFVVPSPSAAAGAAPVS